MKTKSFILTTAVLLATTLGLQAEVNTYKGPPNGLWNDSANWSLGSIPTATQDVFQPLAVVTRISGAAEAGSLTIGGNSDITRVHLREDGAGSALSVAGNIFLAPGAGSGRLSLGVGNFANPSTLTVGGGTGSILHGGGAGVSAIEVFGTLGTLGVKEVNINQLLVSQNTSGSLTIGAGQDYTLSDSVLIGFDAKDVTHALTVEGNLVTPNLNIGNVAANADGGNAATLNLNEGGVIRATNIRRRQTIDTTFNWNGGTIQNTSGANLNLFALNSTTLTIQLAETGTRTFEADSGRTITVQSTAILADKAGESGSLTKAGEGTLSIESASTYTGTTTISAGTLLVSATGSIASSGGFMVDTNGTLDVTAAGLTVGSGKFVGGDGTITGNVTLASGALFAFDTANTLTLSGNLSVDSSFGVASLRTITGSAIDWSTIALGEYTLLNTSFIFDENNIQNYGFENRATGLAGGREAYFQNGSLELVVIPEPSTYGLIAGLLALGVILLRRRMK
jgi:autotransporter-associated beta strand protein